MTMSLKYSSVSEPILIRLILRQFPVNPPQKYGVKQIRLVIQNRITSLICFNA